jgi:hypothetical protein
MERNGLAGESALQPVASNPVGYRIKQFVADFVAGDFDHGFNELKENEGSQQRSILGRKTT